MKIEHFALNVADPPAMADWYARHLGMTVVRCITEAPYTHFLADSSGAVMLEIYRNPEDRVPDYLAMDPLILHLAFVCPDPGPRTAALTAAGATLVQEQHLDDGSHLVMLRDPWGLAVQLRKRGTPLMAG